MKDRRYFFKYASMIYRISHRDLHSFPTRRSSDLPPMGLAADSSFFCCALQKMTESVCLT